MAVSEAQKRASNKYNREHMATLACKVKKIQAEKFKAYAESKGTTANALIKDYVLEAIQETGEPAPDRAEQEENKD